LVEDAAYKDVRDPWAHVGICAASLSRRKGRAAANRFCNIHCSNGSNDPAALASTLRQHFAEGCRPAFRVSNIRTQTELIYAQTIRERLLAMLAAFFGGIALLLAGIGLYGVLSYSVLQREREFGIRIAMGARIGSIARLLTAEDLRDGPGWGGGWAGAWRGVRALCRDVALRREGQRSAMLALPALVLFAAAFLAALPAVVRAARIDPGSHAAG
jgi:putative ABC transport system permease protein